MISKRRYLSYLRERWWVVMVCMALALGTVIAYETVRPDTFSSFSQLYASGEIQLNVGNLFSDAESQTYYGTQIELLKSARLQDQAYTDIGYTPKPGEKAPVKVEVVQPMNTSILVLQATGSDPTLTQRFLQALVDDYLAFKKEMRNSSSEEVVLSLTDQLAGKERDLNAEQDKWTGFQRTNNVALLEEESRSAGAFLADQNVQIANLNLQRELLERGLAPSLSIQPTNAATTNGTGTVGGGMNGNFAALSMTDASIKAARVDLMLKQAQWAQVLTNGPQYLAKPLGDQVAQIQQNLAALEAVDAAKRQAELQETEERISAISNANSGMAGQGRRR